MAKTRAEIQKAYRARKKAKDGENYLQKERKRRMSYYVPSRELSRKEKIKRNMQNRERVNRHRQKKRDEARAEAALEHVLSPGESSGYDSGHVSSTPTEPLLVRMNFPSSRRSGTRKRISRALSTAHREIRHVKNKYNDLWKRYRTLQRRNQRRNKTIPGAPQTPRSQARTDLQRAGISPQQGDKIRRQLVLGNALLSELRGANDEIGRTKGKVNVLKSIVCGKIIKKYRGLQWLSSKIGIGRNRIGKVDKKWVELSKQKRRRIQHKYKEEVQTFFERDDVSRSQPGKGDTKKTADGLRTQTRVLTDYLVNLHMKFLSENPSIRISLATFCRMRPKHILLTRFISRNCCLCTKHQNMALVLKALKREGVNVSTNPEKYNKATKPTDDELQNALPDKVKFGQWKRVAVLEKGKSKNVMRIVETELERGVFLASLKTQTAEFHDHVRRVKTQYDEIRRLKENLLDHHVILHMDFAENFNCKSVEEIQSAYWNQTSVTLHPIVVYYQSNGNLSHKSFVVVSDELSHSSTTVHAILDKIMQEVRQLDSDVQMVHYWTDGPTSQYRNKQVFYTVANHYQIYGVKARWNYFEVGHGKGPCDGLGGTTKRMADEAIRSGKAVIQDAADFYRWAFDSNMKAVTFLFVTAEACQEVSERLALRKVTALRGTFKLHAVIGLGDSTVAYRETSCYCQGCMENELCNGWSIQRLKAQSTGQTTSVEPESEVELTNTETGGIPESTGSSQELRRNCDVVEGDYVAAIYENMCYVGKVCQVDEEDHEVEITFMVKKKQLYQWPKREDVLWLAPADILCKLSEPVATGKSKRMFKLDSQEMETVLHLAEGRALY